MILRSADGTLLSGKMLSTDFIHNIGKTLFGMNKYMSTPFVCGRVHYEGFFRIIKEDKYRAEHLIKGSWRKIKYPPEESYSRAFNFLILEIQEIYDRRFNEV